MKILYHHRTLGNGAEGIHIREIIKAFRNMGHEVQVVGPVGEMQGKKPQTLEKIKSMIPRVVFELCEIGYNLYGFIMLHKAVRSFKPDFIYDRYITFNGAAVLVGKYFGIPVIEEVNAPLALERSSQPDEKLYFKKIAYRIEKWVSGNATKTLVVSTPLAEYLQSTGVSPEKLLVMPNGVDKKKFYPSPKSKNLLTELGISEGDIIVGFSGILRPWHGLDLLIDAIEKVFKKDLAVFLLIVGDGPIRADIEKKIKAAGLKDRYKITGLLDHQDVPSYVNLFDIAVSPHSTFYASPMKLIEYMALGKAIAVPESKNFLDIVDPDINGMTFKEGDADALGQVICRLSEGEALRDTLGNNARLKVENRLNWEWNARAVCDLV